jgi:hypothetical protein
MGFRVWELGVGVRRDLVLVKLLKLMSVMLYAVIVVKCVFIACVHHVVHRVFEWRLLIPYWGLFRVLSLGFRI